MRKISFISYRLSRTLCVWMGEQILYVKDSLVFFFFKFNSGMKQKHLFIFLSQYFTFKVSGGKNTFI